MLALMLMVGVIFGALAGMMAWLITYEEYVKHFPDRRRALQASTETAAFTFAFFLALSVVIGFVVDRGLLFH